MLKSNAEIIQERCEQTMKLILLTSDVNFHNQRDILKDVLSSIYDLVEPYISAEQREDDEFSQENARLPKQGVQEPGLSGHEMAAFEEKKFNDTLGEDPGIAI